MNSSGGKTPSTARPSAYNANAMAMIRNELSQYANSGDTSTGQQSPQPQQSQQQVESDCNSLRRQFTNGSILQQSERDVIIIRQMLAQVAFDVSSHQFSLFHIVSKLRMALLIR